jgi:quercetin dioxygenase-like cupin family protein
VLCDTRAATADPPPRPGVLWKLAEPGRQLDANLVHLPPGSSVAAHAEHDLDVALLAVAGSGTLGTGPGGTDESLTPGALAWLPRGATRSLSAGPEGLSYVTVHRARPGLSVRPRPEGWQVMGG